MTSQTKKQNKKEEMPHDIYLEQELLGSFMHDNNNTIKVQEIIVMSDFYEPIHQKIYYIITQLIDKGHVANITTIASELKNDKVFNDIGAISYLNRLLQNYIPIPYKPHFYDFKDIAQRIKDLSLQRDLIVILITNVKNIMNNKTNPNIKAEEYIKKIGTELFKLTSNNNTISITARYEELECANAKDYVPFMIEEGTYFTLQELKDYYHNMKYHRKYENEFKKAIEIETDTLHLDDILLAINEMEVKNIDIILF